MTMPGLANMGNHADLIDTIVCVLFGTASIAGSVWLLMNLESLWSPAFMG